MLNLLFLITAALTLYASSSLTLEGSWSLRALPTANSLAIETSITEQIFRKQEIINKIEFTSCDSLGYQANVVEDNIYINIETERQQSLRQCTPEETSQINLIKRWIRGVLKFEIVDDKLIIMDSAYDPIFRFQRASNITRDQWSRSITGSWYTYMYNDPSTTYVVIADGSQLSICSGAIFNYKIAALYHISVSLAAQGACQNQQLLNNVRQIRYYQKLEDRLQLYDGSINLLFTAVLSPKQVTSIPKSSAVLSVDLSITGSSPQSKGFNSGKYFLLLLYKRSFGRRSIQVASQTITLQICSQLVFSYKILENNTIKVTSDSAPNNNCSLGDEAYYFNTLTSITKFTIDPDGIITLVDNNSKLVASLSIK